MSTPLPKTELLGDFAICDKDIVLDLNKNFEILDILTQATVNEMVSVLPTSGMMDGDTYILDTNNSINYWNGTSWIVIHPKEGWEIYDEDTATFYFYDGLVWNSGSTLASNVGFVPTPEILSTNVQDAIEDVQHNLTTLDTTLTNYINSLFPVGMIQFTLADQAPNSLDWLKIDQDLTLSRTTYNLLFNHLNTNGLVKDLSLFPYSVFGIGDGSTTFTIKNLSALSPRGIGTNTLNLRTKDGPILGEWQEDQMQRITGGVSGMLLRNANSASGQGAMAFTQESNSNSGLNSSTQNVITSLTFNSGSSPGARVSLNANANGETRVNSFGVYYWIRY